ncbi:hypothetical protein ACT7DG_00765 [Bacillus cereus]
MSLFKNRIPKNSVSFSEETYELQFPKPTSVQIEEEELQADHAELRAQTRIITYGNESAKARAANARTRASAVITR